MRHELLISLRSVNAVEKELVDEEWMTWLSEELYRCNCAAQMLSYMPPEELEKKADEITKLRHYCGDCHETWENIGERFTALS